jgi:hypothetical protein
MKKSNIQGKLKKYRRSGFRAMVIKVPWKKTPGYCCSYVSDTSTFFL